MDESSVDPTLLRAFATLMVCVAAIGALLWFVRRRTSRAQLGDTAVDVRVLSRQALSPKAQLSIVQIGNRVILLGITDTHVSMLGDLDAHSNAQPDNIVPAALRTNTPQPGVQFPSKLHEAESAPENASKRRDTAATATQHPTAAQLAQAAAASRSQARDFEPAYGPDLQQHTLRGTPDLSVGAYMRSVFRRSKKS